MPHPDTCPAHPGEHLAAQCVTTPEVYEWSMRDYLCLNCGQRGGNHWDVFCNPTAYRNRRGPRFQYSTVNPTERTTDMPTDVFTPLPENDVFTHCDDCSGAITDHQYDYGNYRYCQNCDSYRCMDCDPCDRYSDCDGSRYHRGAHVHQWDYRPSTWRPKGNYPAQPLLGVELEVGGSERDIVQAVRSVDASEDHLYMKYDGSISGVEIVTHPATLEWTRAYQWPQLLVDLQQDCYVDDEYGLHIHVARNAFRRVGKRSVQHQMTWLMFLYRHAEELQGIARRRASSWAKFGKPVSGELKRKAEQPDGGDRYVAVNCNNQKTYELRFFASTLDTSEFMGALEFADASVEYTRGIRTTDVLHGRALTWDHFRGWVDDNNYPHLSEQIALHAPRQVSSYQPIPVSPPRPRIGNPSDAYTGRTLRLRTAVTRAGDGGVIAHRAGLFEDAAYEVRYDCRAMRYELRNADPAGWPDTWAPLSTFTAEGWYVVRSAVRPRAAAHAG